MVHLWSISTKQLNVFQDWYLYVNKGSCTWLAPRPPIPTSLCWQAGLHSPEPHSCSCWTWGTRAWEAEPSLQSSARGSLTSTPLPLTSILQHPTLIGSTTASLAPGDALTCCMSPAAPGTCSTHPTPHQESWQPNMI